MVEARSLRAVQLLERRANWMGPRSGFASGVVSPLGLGYEISGHDEVVQER